ncbi:MAG: hypothetical protein ACRC5A_05060 [Enterobacteriaceae bacterium]
MSNNQDNEQINPWAGWYPPPGHGGYPPPPGYAMPYGAPGGQAPMPVWPHPLPPYPPACYGYPPHLPPPHPYQTYYYPQNSPGAEKHPHEHPHHPHPIDWSSHAQEMVENMMGEQAGLLKKIVGGIGMDDKEFWKGAMIGAAATLLLTNDSVRQLLLQTLSGTGEFLKTGGEKVRDEVKSGVDSVKQSAVTGGTIFRDTIRAGKEGFHESVKRHGKPAAEAAEETAEHEQQQ